MKYTLRPYQEDAVTAAMNWLSSCLSPQLLVLATGAGKSLIVADIANKISGKSGKKVLCLAPTKELVQQNHEKYLLTGEPASIFSASAGRKETKHAVVFGSPQTVVNSLDKFGAQYAAIVVDEAHGLTPTLMKIIEHIKEKNPMVRVIGLSATPYRLNTGRIYADHYKNGPTPDDEAIEPYFAMVTYEIGARELVDAGYLTPPTTQISDIHYDTSGLDMKRGKFTDESIDRAFNGQGRKTSKIVARVIDAAKSRRGVMFFAATRQHAAEIMESLPPELSGCVTGEMGKKEREETISAFKSQRIKYLVNISVLTTGFDASHVDLIALCRATESAALLQQIVGRGLRLDDDKVDCLIMDFAENIDRHFPDGDIFAPEIKVRRKGESEPIKCVCEQCGSENEFPARPNPDENDIDQYGYFTDLAGDRIMVEQQQKHDGAGNCEPVMKPVAAHFGRRCQAYHLNRLTHEYERCSYKWSFKECHECGHENDIAARYCKECKCEIVDPNEKLREEQARIDNDPYAPKTSECLGMMIRHWPGQGGKPDTVRVDFQIDDTPMTVSQWYCPNHHNDWLVRQWDKFCFGAFGKQLPMDEALSMASEANKPDAILYRKKKNSKYFEVTNVFFGA